MIRYCICPQVHRVPSFLGFEMEDGRHETPNDRPEGELGIHELHLG
jgi:hypothetical protein